jgi:hypothetical protein
MIEKQGLRPKTGNLRSLRAESMSEEAMLVFIGRKCMQVDNSNDGVSRYLLHNS